MSACGDCCDEAEPESLRTLVPPGVASVAESLRTPLPRLAWLVSACVRAWVAVVEVEVDGVCVVAWTGRDTSVVTTLAEAPPVCQSSWTDASTSSKGGSCSRNSRVRACKCIGSFCAGSSDLSQVLVRAVGHQVVSRSCGTRSWVGSCDQRVRGTRGTSCCRG